jgi:hypothetical protein
LQLRFDGLAGLDQPIAALRSVRVPVMDRAFRSICSNRDSSAVIRLWTVLAS